MSETLFNRWTLTAEKNGIITNNKLIWELHIDPNSLNLCILRNMQKSRHFEISILYFTQFSLHLNHGLILWDSDKNLM